MRYADEEKHVLMSCDELQICHCKLVLAPGNRRVNIKTDEACQWSEDETQALMA